MSFETFTSSTNKKGMFKHLLGCLCMCKELSGVIGTNKRLLLTFNLWLTNNVVSCSSQEEEMFVPSCVIQKSLEGFCEVL